MKTLKKLKIHKLFSVLIFAVGVLLLIYMVVVESEPGAVPLLLIVSGAILYFITRRSIRSQHKK